MVLWDLLRELSYPCKLKLYIVHAHHGPSDKKDIQDYRNKAKEFISKLCHSQNMDFSCSKPPKQILKNEEDLRKFRHSCFKQNLRQKKAFAIALAHNKNDCLETRLIQLIRGCGATGLQSLSHWKAPYLRPLLFWTRQEIRAYALKRKLKWLEDPSNEDNYFLRNWIRNKWLIDLETKRRGAVKTLARSLELLGFNQGEDSCFSAVSSKGIDRKLLMEMSLTEQKRVIAFYMRQAHLSGYGQSHIEEILKHNERKEKKFSIKVLKKIWHFNTDYIYKI